MESSNVFRSLPESFNTMINGSFDTENDNPRELIELEYFLELKSARK